MGWCTKYNPTDIAAQLQAAKLKAAAPLSVWQQLIRPSASEFQRLHFTLYLLPLALCHLDMQGKNSKFERAIEDALEIYLDSHRDKNEIVTVGDYMIWAPENEALAHILREEYFLAVTPDMFDHERIKMNILLRAAAQTRKRAVVADFQMGPNNSPGGVEAGLMSVIQMFAVTFSKQILKADLSAYNPFAPDAVRLNESVPLAINVIGPLYLEIMRTIKA